jgi:flagellar hook protein FlgE
MFAAISGLKAHQIMLDVTANDIANVNTIGYKASRTTFKDSLAQLQRGGSGQSGTLGGSNPSQVGLGVQLGSIDSVMGSGALMSTGSTLDVAVQGDGWFRIAASTPPAAPPFNVPAATTIEYTRAGNFSRNDQGFLVTADGYYVIGRDTQSPTATPTPPGNDVFINIPQGATSISIGPNGEVTYIPAGGTAPASAGFISLAKFANPNGLERAAASHWRATTASGGEQLGTPSAEFGQTASGSVEMSNVDLAQEFTNMISAQRGFQANTRVISAADQMLQDLVQLGR